MDYLLAIIAGVKRTAAPAQRSGTRTGDSAVSTAAHKEAAYTTTRPQQASDCSSARCTIRMRVHAEQPGLY